MARNRKNSSFTAIRIEGGILPPEFLAAVAALEAKHQTGADYGLTKSLTLKDELARYWRIANDLYTAYAERRDRTDVNPIKVGVDDWLIALLKEVLGFSHLAPARSVAVGDRTFPITHQAFGGAVPVLLTTREFELDRSDPRFGEDGRRRAPHGLMQELLNASDDSLWGIVANGAKLRLLRDNPSFTRPAYIEADLDLIFAEQLYPDFAVLWLLGHPTRLKPVDGEASDAFLERWRAEAHETGERALEHLREGVTEALRQLGNGFLQHPHNESLRGALSDGTLSAERYFQELLRLVYRLLFLFTAEERGVLHTPNATDDHYAIYAQGYSLVRLRDRALKRRQYDRHHDLWRGLKLVFNTLSRGEPALGLPALSGLFATEQCKNLEAELISNERLLEAVRALAYFRSGSALARVNYRDMDTEELGSVYESLLELHPVIDVDAAPWTFGFGGQANSKISKGSERRITGSYYTPSALVNELIKSALEPVLIKAIEANPADPRTALLSLKVIDPACGSGHFLLAAARRIAAELARIEAGSDTPDEAARQHALREVVQHCIYGVDRNPLAVELCRTALWIETVEPGKPLTFLDSHILCGDSLLGVFDLSQLRDGIPDEAYKPLNGDDRKIAKHYKAKNKREKAERLRVEGGLGLARQKDLEQDLAVLTDMPEETVDEIAEKWARFQALTGEGSTAWALERACDLWTSTFFARKIEGGQFAGSDGMPRRGAETVATSGTLWEVLRGREPFGPLTGAVAELASHYRFFHWPIAFADVMARGGFDLVLGNPPWETMSPDHKEFFSTYDPEVRFMAPADQKTAFDRLLEHPQIAARWEEYCRDLYAAVHFMKSSGRYRLFAPGNLGKGDFNVYRMFVETALAAARQGGTSAQFVPEGFYKGANATAIRSVVFNKFELRLLVGFLNSRGIWFPSVHQQFEFCLYVAVKGGLTRDLSASFRVNSHEDMAAVMSGDKLCIPVSLVKSFSPNAMAVMEFSAQEEIDICARLYARYPKFGAKMDGLPYRHYMAEVHMGNDRALFSDGDDGLPVFEGRMVHTYDYRAKGYVSGRGRSAVWEDLPFRSPSKRIQPQWRIAADDIPDKLVGRIDRYRVGFCDVVNPGTEKCLLAAMIPPRTVCGHSVPTILLQDGVVQDLLLWIGVANSLTMDFVVRKKVRLHMTYTVLDSLPFPRDFDQVPSATEIAKRVCGLCAVGPEMSGFRDKAVDAGILTSNCDVIQCPEHRSVAAAEIDMLVARDVYGLTRKDMLYILDPANILSQDCGIETFKILRNREIRAFGEYRTQKLILDAWDRLENTEVREVAPAIAVSPAPFALAELAALSDGDWARPMQDQRAETGALLAALLKLMDGPLPVRRVRLTAALALEPRLLFPHLNEAETASWRRLIGNEGEPLPDGVAQFVARTNQAWGEAVRNLRGNGQLIEEIQAGTWAPGTGLDGFNTSGWPEGRAKMVLHVLARISPDDVIAALPNDLQGWVNATAA